MDVPPVRYVTSSDGSTVAYTVTGQGRPVVLSTRNGSGAAS
jgi:hypothetical protein